MGLYEPTTNISTRWEVELFRSHIYAVDHISWNCKAYREIMVYVLTIESALTPKPESGLCLFTGPILLSKNRVFGEELDPVRTTSSLVGAGMRIIFRRTEEFHVEITQN